MRIRTLKPEFWRDDKIATLDHFTRLLFIGLWSYVDDNGVGLDRLADICGDLFAPDMEHDPMGTFARITGGLQELSSKELIVRYEASGKRYLAVVNWKKHQRIDKPSAARYPAPTCDDADSGKAPGGLPEGSTPGTGEQGNRGTGEQDGPSDRRRARTRDTTTARGTRLPEPFDVTPDMRAWAKVKAPHAGAVDHEAFCDHWRAQPGLKGRKTDWEATWRNWMRRASAERAGPTSRAPRPSTADQRVADGMALLAKYEAMEAETEQLALGAIPTQPDHPTLEDR